MIETAETGHGTYRRGFADNTFFTAWHMSQVPGEAGPVRLVTKVGTDTLSADFIPVLEADRLDTSYVDRVPDRTMGRCMIKRDRAERSFDDEAAYSAACL